MLSLILKILRDKVGELYNSINRKMQPLPFGDDQDYILDSDTVTVSDFWKDFKKYSQSPALIGVFYVFLLLNIIINLFIIIMSIKKSFIIARNGTFLAICASDYLDVFYQIRFLELPSV